MQVQLGAPQRMVQIGNIVEEETGARGVRLDDKRLVFEGIEVLLDLLVAGFGLHLDGGNRTGHRDFGAFALLAGHEPLHIFRFCGLNLVAGRGEEENSRIAERDGPVAVVGDNEADGHDAVAEIVNLEDGGLLFCVIRFGGDGHLFFVVHLDRGKRGSRLHGRRGVVAGHGRKRQPQQEQRNCPQGSHRARLYHHEVRPGDDKFRHA